MSDNEDEMAEFRECSICICLFDENLHLPRLLQCQHSFCNSCIKSLPRKSTRNQYSISCPICREEHVQNLDKDIPKNRLIINLINRNSKKSHKSSIDSSLVVNQTDNRADSNKACSNNRPWNPSDYLRELFSEIDSNKDGYIIEHELLEALRRGQPDSNFDQKTISILMEKYDKNHDKSISFAEFQELFFYLNTEYEKFIMVDEDGSGIIDSNELIKCLVKHSSYTLNDDFKNFIRNELQGNSRHKITFDHYCRLIIKFDNLKNKFDDSPKHEQFQQYLKRNLFHNFW